jgi:hypothetical protein
MRGLVTLAVFAAAAVIIFQVANNKSAFLSGSAQIATGWGQAYGGS